MVNQRIHNPATGKYYALRERTTKNGKRGQISGLYKINKEARIAKSIKKKFGPVIKKLGST